MMVTLVACKENGEGDAVTPSKYLIGQTVSSLHRLKDINNESMLGPSDLLCEPTVLTNPADGGFFVFGDVSVRKLGWYKLRFSLFDTARFVLRDRSTQTIR